MKCPKDNGELRHSSPSTKLGIKAEYASRVYVCDTCHGVWIENPQVASLKREQVPSHRAESFQRVQCPSCHSMVAELVEAEPGIKLCSHCLAILRYETLHIRARTI